MLETYLVPEGQSFFTFFHPVHVFQHRGQVHMYTVVYGNKT